MKLIKKQDFTNVKNAQSVLFNVDWLECRVNGQLDMLQMSLNGYEATNDKGNATHNNIFETKDFTILWNIKHEYIKDKYIHLRLSNRALYGIYSPIELMNDIIKTYFINVEEVFLTRCDLCFDMLQVNECYQYLVSLFNYKQIDNNITRYGTLGGKFYEKEYKNYYAGNRGSRLFYRLYNKSIENTDYQTLAPKKPYIKQYFESYFGDTDIDIWRFEIEYKPIRLRLSDFELDIEADKYFSKFFATNRIIRDLGLPYDVSEEFDLKKAIKLVRLLFLFDKSNNNSGIGLFSKRLFSYLVEKYNIDTTKLA
jgi:hypothetical protein